MGTSSYSACQHRHTLQKRMRFCRRCDKLIIDWQEHCNDCRHKRGESWANTFIRLRKKLINNGKRKYTPDGNNPYNFKRVNIGASLGRDSIW